MKSSLRISTLFLIVAFPVCGLFSQEMEVWYNLFNDSLTYVKNGKILKKPRLKKGDQVTLHLTEFNPFLYRVDVAVEKVETASLGGENFAQIGGFLPGIPGFGGGEALASGEPQGSGGLPLFDFPLFTFNDKEVTLRSLFSGSRGSADLLDQAHATMREIAQLTEETQSIYKDIKQAENTIVVSRLAEKNLERLKQNTNLKPSLIKKIAEEYYVAVFQKPGNEEVGLNDLKKWQELSENHAFNYQKLQAKQRELSTKVEILQQVSGQLADMDMNDAEYAKFIAELSGFQQKSRALNDQLKTALAKGNNAAKFPSLDEMSNLQLQLAEITTNDFTYHSKVQVSGDVSDLKIKVFKKSAPTDGQETPVAVKERTIRLDNRSGLQINPSVGMNFGRFFSPGQNYSVQNNLIIGEDSDLFVPVAASLLNFYANTGSKFSIGGTFGAGFPISGDEDTRALQFFLGPSLIFGNTQRLVLSFGLMGGKVETLAKGFKVGDTFDPNNGDLPTKGKYDLGMFMGLSFNLRG